MHTNKDLLGEKRVELKTAPFAGLHGLLRYTCKCIHSHANKKLEWNTVQLPMFSHLEKKLLQIAQD